MKTLALLAAAGAMMISADVAAAQNSGMPVQKEGPQIRVTETSYGDIEWTGPLGYRLRPSTSPLYCNDADVEEVAKVTIDTELYRSTEMISPDQAKALALCAVPGQISSGEMEMRGDRTVYQITLLPRDKQTHSKVEIDAHTGEVINATQFGGLRGLAGFLRESAERKQNKARPQDP